MSAFMGDRINTRSVAGRQLADGSSHGWMEGRAGPIPDDSWPRMRDRGDVIPVYERFHDESRGRSRSPGRDTAVYQSRSYHDEETLRGSAGRHDMSRVRTPMIEDLPAWAQQLFKQQSELLAMLAPSEDNSQIPRYNCKQLVQDAAPAEIEDWIAAIKEGNRQKPGRSDAVRINWALSQASWEIQTDWRAYRDMLEYDKPEEDASLSDFWRFIRKLDVNRELYERTSREKLMELRQGKDESPKDFFSRWQVLVHKLEQPCQFEDNPRLAFDYWYKLQDEVKQALVLQRVSLKNAVTVSHEAEKHWSICQQNKAAKANNKRPHTEMSQAGPANTISVRAEDRNPVNTSNARVEDRNPANIRNVRAEDRNPAKMRGSEPNSRIMNADRSKSSRAGEHAKSRCFNCSNIGHIAKNCPEDRRPKNGRKAAGAPLSGVPNRAILGGIRVVPAQPDPVLHLKQESE